MREAVVQARRMSLKAVNGGGGQHYEPAAAGPEVQTPRLAAVTAVIDQKQPGFFTRVIKRIFGKAA